MAAGLIALLLCILFLVWSSQKAMTARLRGIERKLNALLRHQGVDPRQGLIVSDRVKQLATDPARKIDAIIAYREETGAGLAEAKEVVEAVLAEAKEAVEGISVETISRGK